MCAAAIGPTNGWAEPARVQVLHPGDVAFAHPGDRLETLLGSCVSIILTDPRRTVAVMCHIVHSGAAPGKARAVDTSHAEPALAAMFSLLRGCGISPQLCEAYLYGGGNMFPVLFQDSHIGENNVDWALHALAEPGIRIVGRDTGGTTYRHITWTVGPQAPQVRLGEA